MGESKTYRSRFFGMHPVCCFCGGSKIAEEIEHIPPRIMFKNKHRPKGFEFPTCIECNRASRKSDSVVAFFSKFAKYDSPFEMGQDEFEKEAKALLRYCPETFDEILSGRYGNRRHEKDFQAKTDQKVAIVSIGEKQREHINLFAVKLTAATFYQISRQILTNEKAITVFIHTSSNVFDGTFPEILSALGCYQTMRQGNWTVESQFAYRYALTDDGQAGAFHFVLQNNLSLATFIFDRNDLRFRRDDVPRFSIGDIRAVSDERRSPYPSLSMKFDIASS